MKRDDEPAHSGPVPGRLKLPAFAGREAGRPFVVALEGTNGAGKTTLCERLARRFAAPAGPGTDDAWLAEALKTRMIRDAEWFVSAMFFISGCCERMRVLREQPNPLVILDRSLWSTLAVHSAESQERLEMLLAMLRPVAAQIHLPDLTLVLETDLATRRSRSARKSGPARQLDDLTATPALHAREQEFYRWLAAQRSEVLLLDANHAGPETLAEQAAALIRTRAGTRIPARPPGGPDETSAGTA